MWVKNIRDFWRFCYLNITCRRKNIQSWTKENVFINAHYLTQQNYLQINALRKEYPLPQFKVASYKCLGIRLSFEDPTTLLPGGGGGGKNRSATKFRKNARQICNFLNSFVQDCCFNLYEFFKRRIHA